MLTDSCQFYAAPQDVIDRNHQWQAVARGLPGRPPSGRAWQAKHVMSPTMVTRVRDWEAIVRAELGLERDQSAHVFMNATQSAARCGVMRVLPTLITNAQIWSMHSQRLLIPEMWEVQGFSMFEKGIPTEYMCPFRVCVLDTLAALESLETSAQSPPKRACRRGAGAKRRQGELEWFKGLDEKGQVDLSKAYKKAKTQAEKDRTKVKFSIKRYTESVVTSTGLRGERRRRLMSETQFIAWATSDEGDNLSKQQAILKWQEMKANPMFKKEGPKGPKQKIYVPIHKDLIDYEDVGLVLICFVCEQRAIEQEGRLSNSLDQGQLEDRTRSLVLSRHDQGFGSDLGAAVDLLGDDGDDAGEAQGLRAPVAIANVQDLARPSRRLSTGSASKTAGDTGDSSDDDSGSDREKGKWFDVASETQKFKRRAETLCTKMRTRMDQLIQQRSVQRLRKPGDHQCAEEEVNAMKVLQDQKDMQARKTKAKAKAKGKATAKNTAEPYAMFSTDAEFANCPSSESLFDDERGGTFMLGTPFKGVLEKASEFLEAFSKEFQCSDVRVMTGKAQKDVGVLQSELRHALSGLLPKDKRVIFADDLPDEASCKQMKGWMEPTLWASIAGQRSSRLETAGLPVIRYQFAGSRALVIVPAEILRGWLLSKEEQKKEQDHEKILFVQLQNRFMHLSNDECMELSLEPDKVWYTTVDPGEWIYIPAACIVAEKTDAQEDNVGLKLAFIDTGDTNGLRSMRQEAIDSKRTLPILDAVLQFVEKVRCIKAETGDLRLGFGLG
ncbi:unnamed protein product [Symbiodinium sp. KB8]|nr:unnamed protein product [Symbiodinium sp. KB8]